MDELDDILNAIEDDDEEAFAEMYEEGPILPGELREEDGWTDEKMAGFKVEDLMDDDGEVISEYGEDEFEGDPLLIGADGKPLSDDQLKLLYCISRYSHKVSFAGSPLGAKTAATKPQGLAMQVRTQFLLRSHCRAVAWPGAK